MGGGGAARSASPEKNPKVRRGPEAAVPTHFGAPTRERPLATLSPAEAVGGSRRGRP